MVSLAQGVACQICRRADFVGTKANQDCVYGTLLKNSCLVQTHSKMFCQKEVPCAPNMV
jgi:hypothetical protein